MENLDYIKLYIFLQKCSLYKEQVPLEVEDYSIWDSW